MSTCIFMITVMIVLRILDLCNKTILTLILRILNLVLADSSFEFHILFFCTNIVLVILVYTIIAASGTVCLALVLPNYIKGPISFRVHHQMWFGWSRLLYMLNPNAPEAAATLEFFVCMCGYVRYNTVKLSAKTKSRCCV